MTTSSNRRYSQVGLDRLVRLDWLQKTASHALAGNDVSETKAVLQGDLKDAFVSSNSEVRGSMDKTVTILIKVWLSVPRDLESFRHDGLELLRRVPQRNHAAVHWGMVMAAYPFWASVAAQVGRLLTLQGNLSAMQVQRRVKEMYGERETVSRRTRYVLRSYVDWGVLKESDVKGVYTGGVLLSVDDPILIAWLVEASLHARANGSAPLRELLDSPSLFPFRLTHMNPDELLRSSPRLEIHHGFDEDLVMLR